MTLLSDGGEGFTGININGGKNEKQKCDQGYTHLYSGLFEFLIKLWWCYVFYTDAKIVSERTVDLNVTSCKI